MNQLARPETRLSIRRHQRAGAVLVFVLVALVGGWAGATDIAGAVIAAGQLVVDSNVKKVQHPTGGIVGELNVRDGDRVKSGEVLVRLDETVTRANLAIVSKGLNEMMARKARLEAERDGTDEVTFPSVLVERLDDPEVASIQTSERRLFDLRRSARSGQKSQLSQRIAQLKDEVGGHVAQEAAKSREISLIERELAGARELWDKNLMPISKLTALEREATRLSGERGQLIAQIAQVRGKISEIELQMVQIDRDLGSEVGKELREIDARIGEFLERKVAAEDQLKRVDIRAPQDGVVHQSVVHTVGGVVTPGEVLMLIVPANDKLMIEARVAPQDIDQVRVGQTALLRFTALNQRTTPEILGEVLRVSADVTSDQRSGLTYFTIRLGFRTEEVARLGSVTLIPGMPVEAFVQTGNRKVISYLVKPMHDQIMRAFRER